MRRVHRLTVLAAAIVVPSLEVSAAAAKCPPDSVQVGPLCVDRYEASAWEIPAASRSLVKRVAAGKVAGASQLAGATERGAAADDYGPGCPDDASAPCAGLYAVSIPGVVPARKKSSTPTRRWSSRSSTIARRRSRRPAC